MLEPWFENQAEAILSADQCRNYQELTTRKEWLIAE